MPEAAECRLNADFLESAFNNEPVINLTLNSGRFIKENAIFYWDWISWDLFDLNQPFYITNVTSKGKYLYGKIEGSGLEDILREPIYFESKLGMTGFWTDKELKHNHITFELLSGKKIHFNDARTFGNFNIITETHLENKLHNLGVQFLNTNQQWKEDIFSEIIKLRLSKISDKTQVCEVLLDQSIFCGVGNYLKAEILYACNIHPASLWNKLSEFQIWNLFVQARILIKKAYKANGASFKSFKDSNGQRTGTFSDEFQVYGRSETPDRDKVMREVFKDKRVTWYSPIQQKLFT